MPMPPYAVAALMRCQPLPGSSTQLSRMNDVSDTSWSVALYDASTMVSDLLYVSPGRASMPTNRMLYTSSRCCSSR